MITEGSLQDFALPDLLQILVIGKASGTLTLRSESRVGQFFFREGQLVTARVGDRWGKQAAAEQFLWQTGVFDFAQSLPDNYPEGTGELSLDAVTHEGLRQLERSRTLQRELPEFFSARTWVFPMQLYQESKPPLVEALGSGATFAELVKRWNQGELFTLEEVLALYKADQIGLSSSPEEQLRQLFERVSVELFGQFASISGVKMVESLEHQLNEEARQRALTLRWRGGKPQDGLSAAATKEQLLEAYRPFIAVMTEFIAKVYGETFIERVVGPILEEVPAPQRALWEELNSLPAHP
jgi:hypothetical protein